MPSSTATSSSSSSRRRSTSAAVIPSLFFPFSCSCTDSSSISTSSSSTSHRRGRRRHDSNPSTATATSTPSSRSPLLPTNIPQFDYEDATSYSDLLLELRELEHSVISLNKEATNHRKLRKPRRLELWKESVAVEKETEDPVRELTRSMLAMVTEKAMVCGSDMAELLVRYLAVNNPENHHLVTTAFQHVWREIFSGETPPPLWLLLDGATS